MKAKTTVLVFVLLLAVPAALNLATPPRLFSENENRYLQQAPDFSVQALINGSFTASFDQFVTDQFVFRDAWVGVKTICEKALGRRSSGGVYFAEDSYLIEMFESADMERYEKNLQIVADFTQKVTDNLNVSANTMLVPGASMVLADKLPPNAPEIDQRAMLLKADETVPGFVDISDKLASHSSEYIYYRTDHHWTSLGAYYAYAGWREGQGLPYLSLGDYDRQILSDSFYGTTYSKANLYTVPPDTITAFLPHGSENLTVDYNNGEAVSDTIYERDFLGKKDKYSVFLNANQPLVQIKTSIQNGKKLLIIKDSYANSFAQMPLMDYQAIYLIDLRYFRQPVYDFIEENGITDILILYSLKGFAADTNLYYLTVEA